MKTVEINQIAELIIKDGIILRTIASIHKNAKIAKDEIANKMGSKREVCGNISSPKRRTKANSPSSNAKAIITIVKMQIAIVIFKAKIINSFVSDFSLCSDNAGAKGVYIYPSAA